MGPITFLNYDAQCPGCGGRHQVHVQTQIADWGHEYGARDLRVGDRVPLADLPEAGFIEAGEFRVGEPLRVLDGGIHCGKETLFTEITLDAGNRITSLALVRCSRDRLDRVNYLSPLGGSLWDWASTLPDPSDWNEDVLYTDDRVRTLRQRLLLRDVLPARNPHEADLLVELLGATRKGPPTRIAGTEQWRVEATVAYDGRTIALTFVFDDARDIDVNTDVVPLRGGPSRILPADVFRRKADTLAAGVPVYTADLIEDRPLLAKARRQLAQAIVYLEQLGAFILEYEEYVPLAAFWGDRPRADREDHEDRYSRTRIDATLERWRSDLERLGLRERYTVRSAEETHVFMAIHPCPRCGEETPSNLPSRIEADGDDLVTIYAGSCPSCSLPRRFDMRLPDEPLFQEGDAIILGPGRSTCLDPGQLLIAADLFAQRGDGHSLQLAVAALDEILKFLERDSVPEDAITSRAGWAVYEKEPGRFHGDRLRTVRDRYRKLIG